SVAALAALRNPGHILMYAPRISSFAALPQIEIYSVKALCFDIVIFRYKYYLLKWIIIFK
ncbi:hypothetical protein K6U37_11445, partial [Vibrio parahaemolyticus]|uniref:hypothetical protein n=1 Tax=Vibrio parahaemolyticus TaxID=670 RepID=UPI001EECE8DB